MAGQPRTGVVVEWWRKNPDETIDRCMQATGCSQSSAYRARKKVREEMEGTPKRSKAQAATPVRTPAQDLDELSREQVLADIRHLLAYARATTDQLLADAVADPSERVIKASDRRSLMDSVTAAYKSAQVLQDTHPGIAKMVYQDNPVGAVLDDDLDRLEQWDGLDGEDEE